MMVTSIELFDELVKEVKKIADTPDFWFPHKGPLPLQKPKVFEFYLPPPNRSGDDTFPYIVVFLMDEDQKLNEESDQATITFALVVGVYKDSKDYSQGPRDLHIALEHLAIQLKDIHLLGKLGELNRITKKIAEKHPVPYFEGQITLTYSYYKPVKLPEV